MDDNNPDSVSAFFSLGALPDSKIDLGLAALLIARQEYPNLNVRDYLDRLDEMALELSRKMPRDHLVGKETLRTLNHFLFQDPYQFRGNSEEYYDPRNSFLNDVLDRQRGIPITLSVIYMEIGRRVGLEVHGVGMPGHFLAKYLDPAGEIFIDAFDGGALLTGDDCRQKLETLSGGTVPFQNSYLDPVSKKQILIRMCNNLKTIYMNRGLGEKALGFTEDILALYPGDARQLRDMAALCFQLKRYGRAAEGFQRYLEVCPDAPDREDVMHDLQAAVRLRAVVN